MSNIQDTILAALAARHDPAEVLAEIEKVITESGNSPGDAVKVLEDLVNLAVSMNQVIHRLCHIDPRIEQVVDTLVAGGPSALKADLSRGVPADEFLSEQFTTEVFNDYTEGTDPADRIWGITTLPNGQRAITLEGTGFNRRVFAPIGADDEDIEKFKDIMVALEAKLK